MLTQFEFLAFAFAIPKRSIALADSISVCVCCDDHNRPQAHSPVQSFLFLFSLVPAHKQTRTCCWCCFAVLASISSVSLVAVSAAVAAAATSANSQTHQQSAAASSSSPSPSLLPPHLYLRTCTFGLPAR